MNEQKRDELRQKFIEGLTNEDWEVIATALFQRQAQDRNYCKDVNCGDQEWEGVDKSYNLYLDVSTFILGK